MAIGNGEGMASDGGERVGDDQQREPRAAIEGSVANGGDGTAECHRAETGAIGKRPFTDGVHCVGDSDRGDSTTVIEGMFADAHHGVGSVVVCHSGRDCQRACWLHRTVPPSLFRSVGIKWVHYCHASRVKDDVIERIARGCNSPEVIVGTVGFGTISIGSLSASPSTFSKIICSYSG